MLGRLFTEHPRSVGESYGEHALVALSFSLRLLAGGLACLIHAAIPGLFTRTGSGIISQLHDEMVCHRAKTSPQDGAPLAVRR